MSIHAQSDELFRVFRTYAGIFQILAEQRVQRQPSTGITGHTSSGNHFGN
jgi:hypothetical protein